MTDIITVTGIVGTEPHMGDAAGTPVCNFRLASSLRRYDKQTGTWSEYGTNWYSVGAYRYLGTNVSASIHKGDHVVVTGRVRLREWENQAGKGMAIDIDATSIGHDLTWGTSVFQKHGQSAAGDDQQVDDPGANAALSAGQETPQGLSAAAPLTETAGVNKPDGWGTVEIGTEQHEAA